MNPSHKRQEHPYSLALPRGVPQLEPNTQRAEFHAKNHSERVLPQVLYPPDTVWTPTATAAGHRPSVLVTTGRPVVILDESLLARVLGHRVKNNPFATRRSHHPASSPGLMSTALPYHHSLVSGHEQSIVFSEAANGFQAVPDAESLPLSSDMPVVMYSSQRGGSKDWGQHAITQPLGLDCDHPISTSLSEDETGGDDTSLLHAISMQTEGGDAPTANYVNSVPESPPGGTQCLESTGEYPPSEEKLRDQSPLHNSQQECASVSTESLPKCQTQPEPDVKKSSAHDCEDVQVNEAACQEQDTDSESSQSNFCQRILKTWTDSIVAMAERGTRPLLKTENTSISNQSKNTPYNERHLPLRPSRAALVCAEREEQILQDSDSEIELEIPEMELEQQASEQQAEVVPNSLNTEGPPISSKEPCVTIPHPPPPPQLGHPKVPTLVHASIPYPKAVASESKFGELQLQSCFLNSESSHTPTGSLFSLGLTPLSPVKLTNRLRVGLPASFTATDTPQRDSGNANTLKSVANVCPKEPTAKKPRLLDVFKMSENEEPLSLTADSIKEMQEAPQQLFSPKRVISLNQEPLPGDTVASDQNSRANEIAYLRPAAIQQQEAEVLDMVQPQEHVLQVNSPQHPHTFTCSQSNYPHQLCEHAADGMDTVSQALPMESARQRMLVPNLLPCRNEAGSHDGDDGDGRGNGLGAILTAEVEEESIATISGKTAITISKDHEFPRVETLGDEFCTQKPKSPPQTILTVPHTEPQTQSAPANDDQQIVPESSLGSSLSVHSLYDEGDSSKKWDVVPSHSHEDVATEELDGPSVLAVALESMDARKRTLESPECQVPQMSPMRQRSCFSSSSVAWPHPQGLEIFLPSHVNLSKPRLRLGLSKKQRCKPLHH